MINLQNLLDDVKCYDTVRQLRWPDRVRCPHCIAADVTKQGRDPTNRRDKNSDVQGVIAILTI